MRTFGRLLCVALVLALSLGLVGCGEKEATPQETPVDEVLVALIPSDMSDPQVVFMVDSQEAYCEELGYKSTVLDAQGNAQTQANMVSNAIAQGAKAIVVDCCDTKALGTAFMEAKEAGLVVITYNGDVDESYWEYRDAFVGADDITAGKIAADCFVEHFGSEPANVVIVEGAAGAAAQIRRSDGFDIGIEGSGIKVLDRKSCTTWSTSDAMTIAEDFIVMYGDEINGFYCHWDNGGVGIVEALKAAGYEPGDVFMVTIDGCYNGNDLIREGWLYASIMQDCDDMAKRCIGAISDVLNGKEVESLNYINLVKITSENVDDIDPGW